MFTVSKWSLAVLTLSAHVHLLAGVLTVNVNTDSAVAGGGTFVESGAGAGAGDLRGCLNYINNQAPGAFTYDIQFDSAGTITIGNMLPVLNLFGSNTVSINTTSSKAISIDGTSTFSGFFARQGTVDISDISLLNCTSKGGNGGSGAGGALGAGGGLFIDDAAVSLTNVTFSNCSAVGGTSTGAVLGGGCGGGGGMFNGTGGAGVAQIPPQVVGGGGGGGIGSAGGNGGASTGGGFGGGGGGGGILGKGGDGGSGSGSTNLGSGGGGGVGVGSYGGFGGFGAGVGPGGDGGDGGLIGGIHIGGGGGGSGATTTDGGDGGGNGGLGAQSIDSPGGGGGGGPTQGATSTTSAPGIGGSGGGGGGASGNKNFNADGGIGGGGGGGNPSTVNGSNGGYGGGGGAGPWLDTGLKGGAGGFGGGGGGLGIGNSATSNTAGAGGFGGGGGSGTATTSVTNTGGAGGFGGGGGGGQGHVGGASGIGAGLSGSGGTDLLGGGGAGLGGAIFVNTGSLTINGGVTISGGAATGGAGQNIGTGAGSGIFGRATTTTLIFNPAASSTTTISSVIADDNTNSIPGNQMGQSQTPGGSSGLAITKNGAGTLFLGGVNTYLGTTTLSGGTLSVNSDDALGNTGTNTLAFTGNATLKASTTFITFARPMTIATGVTATVDTSGNESTISGVITGAGALEKTGEGTLTLSATNGYAGGTTINGGTISINGDAALGTVGSGIHFTGTSTLISATSTNSNSRAIVIDSGVIGTIDTSGNSYTTTGDVTGPGGLTKIFGGTLTLAGTNNFGPLAITDGSVVLNANNPVITDLSGSGTLTLTATSLTLGSSNSSTFSGVIEGTSPITKVGTGALTLTGVNTYTGTTTLNQGTLVISSDDSLGGNGSGNLNPLAISGDATLKLSTTIGASDRPISIAAGFTGTIDTAGSGFTTAGLISGSGSLTKAGTGDLVLTAANSLGLLTVDGGGVVFAGSPQSVAQLNGAGDVTIVSSSLTVGSSSDSSFTGSISGPGGLIKIGAGTLTLSKVNSYTGPTSLLGGTLSVVSPGSIAESSTVTVYSGATLKGNGTILGSVNVEGGTISPGNSPGTLTVKTLSLSATSTTNIEISPTSASQILITGNGLTDALIDGHLMITVTPGTYPDTSVYTIVQADNTTISGVFIPPISDNDPNMEFFVEYADHTIMLSNMPFFSSAGLSPQDTAIIDQYNQVPGFFQTPGGAALRNLSGQALSDALNSTSPVRNISTMMAVVNSGFSIGQTIFSHIGGVRMTQRAALARRAPSPINVQPVEEEDPNNSEEEKSVETSLISQLIASNTDEVFYYIPEQGNYTVWGSAFAQFGHQNALGANPAYSFNAEGAMLGCDYTEIENLIVGGTVGGMYLNFSQHQNRGNSNAGIFFPSVYASYVYDDFYFESALSAAYTDLKNKRNISFPGFDGTAKAKIPSWQFVPHIGAGYDYEVPICDPCMFLLIEPFFSMDLAVVWQNSYTERGASPFNYYQPSFAASLLRSEVGLKCYQQISYCWGTFAFEESASYVNKAPFGADSVSVAVIGAPSLISLSTYQKTLNLGSAGFSMLAQWGSKQDMSGSLTYQGEYGSGWISNQIYVKFSKDF